MVPNFLIIGASSFIPFFIAYLWFHPKVFGGETWGQLAKLSREEIDMPVKPVKPVKLLLSILLNLLIVFAMYNLTVHASGVFSLLGADAELMKTGTAAAFLAEHGQNHTTFGHGMVHGFAATLMTVIPIIGYATIFERKGSKYFMVNVGFWLISLMLVGGVLSQWGWKLVV